MNTQCLAKVNKHSRSFFHSVAQCTRRNGHGIGGCFCKQHAKMDAKDQERFIRGYGKRHANKLFDMNKQLDMMRIRMKELERARDEVQTLHDKAVEESNQILNMGTKERNDEPTTD